uniref:Uncharacterized protein n=1 Tax=Meloidogyne javanica TaxID=6303 RepID=A0A915N467_MELJA
MDADDEDNSLINPQNKLIKKEFHIDKRGKRWEFLQKIMSQKDLDIVCEENLLEKLDERSDRIRFCCHYSFEYMCPFRAVMIKRKATLFTRFEHNHLHENGNLIEINENNDSQENNEICSISHCSPINKKSTNFQLKSLEERMNKLAEQLSLIFKIHEEVFLFIGNVNDNVGSLLALSDKETHIKLCEFQNCKLINEQDFDKNGGLENFINLLREKCEQFFDVIDVVAT